MSLTAGDKLGPFEILAPIGAGGMGEVYRARDTKLDREVAIKVLPAALAQHPERLARFEREAKVLAALNHPNIAGIYGLEDRAIVMELVEGPTLADRLAAGAIPLEESLKIAAQIADALEAAHEKGVVHRDLKPANVKVRDDGTVKVLDFGLATAVQSSGREPGDGANSPTLTMGATEVGMILGTAAYMSPEQAAGKPVDRRADIWSFGVVLWEMLTGKRLFVSDESVSHTLADVLRAEIDFGKLPGSTPETVRQLLRRCLDRTVKTRLRDIGEARIVLAQPSSGVSAEVTAPSRSRLGIAAWIMAGVMTLALVALAFVHFREQPPAERTVRYTISVPENSAVHSFAVSPDGRLVAIAAAINGKQQLWLRPLDALQAQPMPGTEDATYPFWSPDSRYIGFFAQGRLKKIATGGGPAQTLGEAPGPRGASWSGDGVILASVLAGRIQRIPAAGGVPVDVLKINGVFRYPAFLPDGRHFLYVNIATDTAGIYVGSLDGAENRRVLADRSGAVLTSERGISHLLFVRENNLMAVPFDWRTAQVSIDAVPVAEGVRISGANAGYAPFSVSENGVLVYSTGESAAVSLQATWYDRAGKPLGPMESGPIFNPAISPDEKRVAFVRAIMVTRRSG